MKIGRIFSLSFVLIISFGLVFITIATTKSIAAAPFSQSQGLTIVEDKSKSNEVGDSNQNQFSTQVHTQPQINVSPESLTSIQKAREIVSRPLTISNTGGTDRSINISVDPGVSFLAASTRLYGYLIPGTWLRIIGTQDNTYVRVINLEDGENIDENMDLGRYDIWDVYPEPGTFYKVEASNRVLGYESDFISMWGHTTFIPSLNSGPVGKEFIFYYFLSETSRFYVFSMEDATVQVYDTSEKLVVSKAMAAGAYWEISLPNAVYHITSNGLIAMETVAGNGYSTVPAASGAGVGWLFYFATDGDYSGSFAVFAYQDSDVDVYDLNTGLPLYSQHVNLGEYWMQTGVGTQQLRLESTGMVEVWAGDNEDLGIEGFGDDISFAGGYDSQEFYLHSLRDGSVFFVPFDNTQINVDGAIYQLDKDDYFHLEGCCYYRHVKSNKPIVIQTLGRDSSWNDTGTYLGGVLGDEGISPPPRVYIPCIFRYSCPDFFDDFGNPSSGWDIGEDEFVRYEYLNGEYRVLTKNDQFIYLFGAPTCARESYVVEVDARWVGAPGASYGIVFGITGDFDHYYEFEINTDYQEYGLWRFDGKEYHTIIPITPSWAIKVGSATNRLRVIREGNQITLEVNGVILGTWTDGNISGKTSVGILSTPYYKEPISDARFDNFVVNKLDGNTLATRNIVESLEPAPNLHEPGAYRKFEPVEEDWLLR